MRTHTRVSTSPVDPKLARDAPGGSGVLEVGGGVGVSGARSSGDLAGGPQRPSYPIPALHVLLKGKCGSCVDTVCGVLVVVSHRVFAFISKC